MRRTIAILGALAVLRIAGSSLVAATNARVVSSVAELRSLSSNQLNQLQPFELHGTILCYDADWNQLFLQTKEGIDFITPQGLRTDLKAGDVVNLIGQTVSVANGLPLTNLEALVLGHSSLPPGKPIELADVRANMNSWVELTGQVRLAEISRGRLGLSICSEQVRLLVYVLGSQPTNDCKLLQGALVRVRGIITADTLNGRFTATLMAPDSRQISIVRPSATLISSLPVTSIDAVLNRELGPWTNQPVHLHGIVSDALPGESLLIKDSTGIIRARLVQVTSVAPGERIDLWGYLQIAADQAVLADAYFEPSRSETAAVAPEPSELLLTNKCSATCANLAQLRALSREQIHRGLPVKIRGTVIYSDPEWHTAFVHDGSACVYAQVTQSNIHSGQLVELTGQATFGTLGPAIVLAQFRILGKTNLPPSIPAELDDLADGGLDAQWVQMQGVVQHVTAQWNHLYLSLMSRKGKFDVLLPGFSSNEPPSSLLDASVRVQGICGSDVNGRNQLNGITLYAPSLKHIQIIEAPPADPFDIPSTPIAAVATFNPERVAGRRVKVAGVVTLNLSDQSLYLQDNSGGIRVQTELAHPPTLRPGDSVEVLGFPAMGDFSPHLEEALIRRLKPVGLPTPLAATGEQILLYGTNDASLVELRAELLQYIPHSAQPKLVLQEGPIIFTAQLSSGRFPIGIYNWRPGSLLRLSGVCSIQGSDSHSPQSFRILLPNPEAIALLKAPPAWGARHLLVLAGTLGFVALIAFSWIFALRRQVHSRTTALRTSQATLQREVEHNRALSELGRRLSAAATPKDAAMIIFEVADRLIGWDCALCDMYSPETHLTSHVLNIDLIDGRRVECQPQFTQLPPSPLARRAIESGPQLLLREVSELEKAEGVPFGDTARRSLSILYAPVRNGSNVVAVLSIQSYRPHAYDERDLATLQALADHCSGALERIRAHQRLLEVSRQAGMAEVATGVLHNVGNVLNSVNISVTLLAQHVKDSFARRIAKISDVLNNHSRNLSEFLTSDPKAHDLAAYVKQLAAVMAADEARFRGEVESLAKNIDHIKQIVAMQQTYARLAGSTETIPASDLVEDALRLNAGSLSNHKVQVCRDYPSKQPLVTLDKHKALQILINLIRNAKYACDESERSDKKLTMRIGNGDGRVRISIVDNGVGIPRENLSRIFTLGFSTRKDGHGFGLHSAALAAKELGGSLSVQSEGPGAGATFTLELPVASSN